MSWLSLLFIILFSQQEVDKLIKSSPGRETYPDAGALVLLDSETMEIHKDGSSTITRHLLVKILDTRGRAEYGDITRKYNKEAEIITITTAKTYLPDGRIVEVKGDAITDLSAPEVYRAAAYTNAQLKIVSFPALGENAVIEYECKVKRKKSDDPFFGSAIFGTKEPILAKEFKLIVPEDNPFRFKVVNGDISPEVKKEGNTTSYCWKLENIPAVVKEPHMPPIAEVVPSLVFSSFKSWEDLAVWLATKFYSKSKINKEIRKKVEEIVKGKGKEEIIRDCFLYVATEVRNVKLLVGGVGYEPNKATKVYKNKYGDPRDKAVLLVSLLKEAGIEAMPVYINKSGISIIDDIPSPAMFDHIIVAIPANGGYLLLDPQASDARFGYLPEEDQNVAALILFEKSYIFKKTLSLPTETNKSESTIKLSLTTQGHLKGEIVADLSGYYDRRARAVLKDKQAREKKIWFDGAMSSIATNAKMISHSISNFEDLLDPVQISVFFDVKDFASLEDDKMHFYIPLNPFDFGTPAGYVNLSQRQYSLILKAPQIISYNIEINFPGNFEVDYLTEKLEQENEFAKVSIYTEAGEARITYKTTLVLKKRKITAEEYPEFRSVVNQFLKPQKRLVMLKKII